MRFSIIPSDHRYNALLFHSQPRQFLIKEKLAKNLEGHGKSCWSLKWSLMLGDLWSIRDRASDCGRYAMRDNH